MTINESFVVIKPASCLRHFELCSPDVASRNAVIGLAAVLIALVLGYTWRSFGAPTIDDVLGGVPVHPDMAEHSREFDTPTLYKVLNVTVDDINSLKQPTEL